jgi:hypothetical protein
VYSPAGDAGSLLARSNCTRDHSRDQPALVFGNSLDLELDRSRFTEFPDIPDNPDSVHHLESARQSNCRSEWILETRYLAEGGLIISRGEKRRGKKEARIADRIAWFRSLLPRHLARNKSRDVFRKSENKNFLVVDRFDDDSAVQEVTLVPLDLRSKRRNDSEHKPVSSVSLQRSKINTITFFGDVVFVNC